MSDDLIDTEYGSSLNITNQMLVRVVQYAALYQIFREYGIHDDSEPRAHYDHPEWTVLSDIAERRLRVVLNNDLSLLRAPSEDGC